MLHRAVKRIRSAWFVAQLVGVAARAVLQGKGPDGFVIAAADRLVQIGLREDRNGRVNNIVPMLRGMTQILHEMRNGLEREKEPRIWAWYHRSLGRTMSLLAQRQRDTKRLQMAETAIHEALRASPRESGARDWAAAHILLGNALALRANLAGDRRLVDEAMISYAKARQALPRKDWSSDREIRRDVGWFLENISENASKLH